MFNWVDLTIIAVIAYEVYGGWKRGFASLLADLLSFLASFWLAVRFHGFVGSFITEKLGINATWADLAGYIVITMVSQMIIEALLLTLINKLPAKFQASRVNHWLGSVLSVGNGLVVVSFFLLLILALPLRGAIRPDIRQSVIGSWLVKASELYGGGVKSALSEIGKSAVKFMSVEPGSKEKVSLDLPQKNISFIENKEAETEMVALVNKERTSRGGTELVVDEQMRAIAREKSRDMFERRYFSHYDPDGKNAADRMNAAGVPYTIIGENLAYAPDLASAHEGLMNSEGHRKNMLEPRYHRIGVGVIDGGIHGMMFTQMFAD